jgi:adenosylcobinamide-phosphate synthase
MIQTFSDLHALIFDPARVPLAMAAILVVGCVGMVTGPVFGNANSFVALLVDRIFGGVGTRLDRVQRTARNLFMRGSLMTLAGLGVFFIMGQGAVALTHYAPLHGWTEIVLLSLCMSAGTVWFALLQLFFAMKQKKASKNAYYTIAQTTRTDLSAADDYTITRVGMALAARGFDKSVVGPVVWYLIGGISFAVIYAGVYALAWRFGKDGFTKGFGKMALALEKLMGFVPHILAGVLMAAAGLLTPTGGMTRAVVGLMKPDRRAPYAEGGLPVTAMAESLNVALNGPAVELSGSAMKRAWVGPKDATARLDAGHLRRALYIGLMAHLLLLVGLGASLLFS